MAKTSHKNLSKKLTEQSMALLYKKISKIRSVSNLINFLDAFFTPVEKGSLLKRCAILILLSKKIKYRSIKNDLEVSGTTISNIKHISKGDGYGKNLGRRIYSPRTPRKIKRKKFFRPYKGAESIV